MISPKILFEDPQILVIEKPAGVVTNWSKTTKEETVQDWVIRKLNIKYQKSKNQKEFYQRSGIVHRLDKETSGLLVIAKTCQAFAFLKRQFMVRKVRKKYLALVYGKMEAREGEICLPIKRLPWDREKFGVVPGGKKARTKFKVVLGYPLHPGGYTLLELEPETGRTHQIRVHLKYLGHPVVGDLKYGGRRAKEDRSWCPRLFLHAFHLSFLHPETGKRMRFESPLPEDLEKILQGLKRLK